MKPTVSCPGSMEAINGNPVNGAFNQNGGNRRDNGYNTQSYGNNNNYGNNGGHGSRYSGEQLQSQSSQVRPFMRPPLKPFLSAEKKVAKTYGCSTTDATDGQSKI